LHGLDSIPVLKLKIENKCWPIRFNLDARLASDRFCCRYGRQKRFVPEIQGCRFGARAPDRSFSGDAADLAVRAGVAGA
jgi:hypothetical protein